MTEVTASEDKGFVSLNHIAEELAKGVAIVEGGKKYIEQPLYKDIFAESQKNLEYQCEDISIDISECQFQKGYLDA